MPNPISGPALHSLAANPPAEGETQPAATAATALQRPAGEPPIIHRRREARASRAVEALDLAQGHNAELGPYWVAAFDSSNGGLIATPNIVAELERIFSPEVRMIPVLDHGQAPYGEKSPNTIIDLVRNGLALANDLGADAVVMVCNTACTAFKLEVSDVHKIDIETDNGKALQSREEGIPVLDLIANTAKHIAKYGGDTPVVLSTRATADDETYKIRIHAEAGKLIEAGNLLRRGNFLDAGKVLESSKLIEAGKVIKARSMVEACNLLDPGKFSKALELNTAGKPGQARELLSEHLVSRAQELDAGNALAQAKALLDMGELIVAGAGIPDGKLLRAFLPGPTGESDNKRLLEAHKLIEASEAMLTRAATPNDATPSGDELIDIYVGNETESLAKAIKQVESAKSGRGASVAGDDTLAKARKRLADEEHAQTEKLDAQLGKADNLIAAANAIAAAKRQTAAELLATGALLDVDELEKIMSIRELPDVKRIGAGGQKLKEDDDKLDNAQRGEMVWDWATLINKRMHLSEDPGHQNLVTTEIKKYVDKIPDNASSVYLCCTHYPAFKGRIEQMLADRNLSHIEVIDPIKVQAKALVDALLHAPAVDRSRRVPSTEAVVVSSEKTENRRDLKASVDSLLQLPYSGIVLGHSFDKQFPLDEVRAYLNSGPAVKPPAVKSREEQTEELKKFSDEVGPKLSRRPEHEANRSLFGKRQAINNASKTLVSDPVTNLKILLLRDPQKNAGA